jgi:putative colanic acid biosynthesis acetyltransferase WcaF
MSPFSAKEKFARLLWAIAQATLFRLSFHNFYGWRRFVLRIFGATVHSTVHVRRTVRIECPWNVTIGRNSSLGDFVIVYALGRITIGERVSISQYAHLCAGTHDYTRPDMPLLRLPITVQNEVWIAADAFVGPNVTIHEGAILGARASAYRDLEPWTIYGGNPAQSMGRREYHG